MHLNKYYRVAALLATSTLSGSLFAQSAEKGLTHCYPDERVQFSCRIGAKTVSLCGGGTDGPLTSLAYRYGLMGKIEKEFVARPGNTLRFYGTEGPINPRARLQQVWFDQGNTRYLMTACTGGSCPQHAGLAVIRNYTHILMNVPCRFTYHDFDSFSPELGLFSSHVENSQSATEMLIMEDVGGNDIPKLFPNKGGPMW